MPVPAKRRPRSEARRGRNHLALKSVNLAKCVKCGKEVLSHTACGFCGNYKGKQILTIKTPTTKKAK